MVGFINPIMGLCEYFFTIVVAGIEVFYNDGKNTTSQKYGRDSDMEHEFHLEKGERIVKVTVQSSDRVDCLTFHTNRGRTLGPYGGTKGVERAPDCPPEGRDGWLSGLQGVLLGSYLSSLAFKWTYCPLY